MLSDLALPLAQQEGDPARGVFDLVFVFGLMFMIMYFLIWRPQSQRERERKELLGRLKKNDHVVTQGGIHGVVTSLKDDEVTLRVDEAQNVRIRFQRSAIVGIVGETEKGGAHGRDARGGAAGSGESPAEEKK